MSCQRSGSPARTGWRWLCCFHCLRQTSDVDIYSASAADVGNAQLQTSRQGRGDDICRAREVLDDHRTDIRTQEPTARPLNGPRSVSGEALIEHIIGIGMSNKMTLEYLDRIEKNPRFRQQAAKYYGNYKPHHVTDLESEDGLNGLTRNFGAFRLYDLVKKQVPHLAQAFPQNQQLEIFDLLAEAKFRSGRWSYDDFVVHIVGLPPGGKESIAALIRTLDRIRGGSATYPEKRVFVQSCTIHPCYHICMRRRLILLEQFGSSACKAIATELLNMRVRVPGGHRGLGTGHLDGGSGHPQLTLRADEITLDCHREHGRAAAMAQMSSITKDVSMTVAIRGQSPASTATGRASLSMVASSPSGTGTAARPSMTASAPLLQRHSGSALQGGAIQSEIRGRPKFMELRTKKGPGT